jgi:hypothetical protein
MRGKSVLLYAEQGYGDTIHFARYVPLVAEIAAKVWLVERPAMRRLSAKLGVDLLEFGAELPEHDIVVSLMSLPRAFGTTLENVPAPAKYVVSPRKVPTRIGVCWHGGSRPDDPMAHVDDLRRSLTWEQFKPIVDACEGAVSLQEEHLGRWGCKDWLDTAELVAGLDLVISVDTAILHLAASLGVPTFGLMRASGCWRWLSNGDSTVWYPGMRLFRQPIHGEWGSVVESVVNALGERG